MENLIGYNKRFALYGILIILYFSLGLYFFNTSGIGLNPDLIAYLNIAQKYSRGEILQAINGYWSPLISWLLVPFCWLGTDLLISFKILHLFIGAAIIIQSIKIADRIIENNYIRVLMIAVVTAFSFTYQYSSQTPDLLSALVVLWYITQFMQKDFYLSPTFCVYTALLAAICYFSKSYNLIFVLAHFTTSILVYFFRSNRSLRLFLLRIYFKTLIFLFLFIAPWVAAISIKYDTPTISTAHKFNTTVFSPNGDSLYYTTYAGLIEPMGANALFGWEDPSYFRVKPRAIFESKHTLLYQLGIIRYNTRIVNYMMRYYSYFGWGLAIFLLVFIAIDKNRHPFFTLLVIGILLYCFGYWLIFIKERYLLPAHLLLIISSFYALWLLAQNRSLKTYCLFAATVVLSIALIKNPVSVFRYSKNVFIEENKSVVLAYRLSNKKWLEGKRFATPTSESGQYNFMPLTAMLSRAKFYGELKLGANEKEQLTDLKKNTIDYLFFLGCSEMNIHTDCTSRQLPSYLSGKKPVFVNRDPFLEIYSLR